MPKKKQVIDYLVSNINIAEINKISGGKIKQIRKSYGLTQVNFAKLLMVNYETYRSWEEERRFPSSPGYAVLSIAERYPKVFLENSRDIVKKLQKMVY